MKRILSNCIFVGIGIASGCLPGDTRPEPASIFVTAEASHESVNGFVTEDGWNIKFDKILVGLGNVALIGDACNDYGNAGYDRLFNFTLPGAQKLGDVYGLDACEIRFRLRSPSDDSILENGVTSADRDFMRELNLPEGVTEPPTEGPPPRTAVYVRGSATKNAKIKTFEWKFIARYTLTDCVDAEGKKNTFLHLNGGDNLHPVISFHTEDLFLDGIAFNAVRQFDKLAIADWNEDGNLTLEELAIRQPPEDFVVTEPEIPDPYALEGWAGFMTTSLLPRMVQYDGNVCAIFADGPRGPGGGGPF